MLIYFIVLIFIFYGLCKAQPPGSPAVTATIFTDSTCSTVQSPQVCHILGHCFALPAGLGFGIYAYLPTGSYDSSLYTFSETVFWDSECTYIDIPFTQYSQACAKGTCCETTGSRAILANPNDDYVLNNLASEIVTYYVIYDEVAVCPSIDPVDVAAATATDNTHMHDNIGYGDDFRIPNDDFHHPYMSSLVISYSYSSFVWILVLLMAGLVLFHCLKNATSHYRSLPSVEFKIDPPLQECASCTYQTFSI